MNKKVEWRLNEFDALTAYIDGTPAIWFPQPGSQTAFLRCPIFETLLAGNRGGGKTDVLLMDFAQYVGRGYGEEWKGILFRRTFPELDDIISKSLKWFKKIWPDAEYNKQAKTWTWATGETLKFRHIMRPSEYWNYHGHCVKHGDVLTPTGWKDIKDIKVGDIVYAVDEDRDLIPMPVATKTEDNYDGDLIVHKGRGSFMEFTPNHKVAAVKEGKLVPTKYNSLGFETTIAAYIDFSGGKEIVEFIIPDAKRTPGYENRYKEQPRIVNGDNFTEFMGWFLSEGFTLADSNIVGICQDKVYNVDKITKLLDKMGVEYSSNAHQIHFFSVEWAAYLRQFGKCRDKFVPGIIKNASVRQLRLFFDVLMAGDGSWQDDNAYYFTTSKQLVDDVAEIAVKLGFKVSISSRQRDSRRGVSYTIACRSGERRDIKLRTDVRKKSGKELSSKVQVTRSHYSGKVYCIGLEKHHMFVIRQQGCVWVSGNSYPWIGFEELTTWPNSECYTPLFSLCRSSHPEVAKHCCIRATTNPYGPGHNWVKKRFRLPMADGMLVGAIVKDTRSDIRDDERERPRVAIRSSLAENKILLLADPMYVNTLRAAARNPAELAAWIEGSWDITSGGMFDDLYDEAIHVIPDIPYFLLRKSGWFMNRAYDHGQSKPFSVGWWAESNGNPITLYGKTYGEVKGDLFLFNEYYGCTNEDNKGLNMTSQEIARQIREREKEMGLRGRIKRGPADSSIFSKYDGTKTVAGDMKKEGVYWDAVDKSKGSRVQGWQQIRTLLAGSVPADGLRENKGIFVCERCADWRRTVPCLPRDDKNLDDVNSDVEDHAGDMTRYRLRWTRRSIIQRTW